jgi:hypothetical protein
LIYCFLATGLGLALFLFLSLKRDLRLIEQRCAAQEGRLAEVLRSAGSEIEDLRTRLQDSEERSGLLVPPPPTVSGMNLNKRSQVIRMLRLGEDPARIAAQLSVPLKEVELLAKVQRMLVENVA